MCFQRFRGDPLFLLRTTAQGFKPRRDSQDGAMTKAKASLPVGTQHRGDLVHDKPQRDAQLSLQLGLQSGLKLLPRRTSQQTAFSSKQFLPLTCAPELHTWLKSLLS